MGRRIEAEDDSELLFWVLPGQLACSHRPLRYNRYYGGSLRNLDPEAAPLVIEWAARIRSEGIKSIICLMNPKEVGFYGGLDLGANDLIEFYRAQGFDVCWLPWEDPAHSKADKAVKRRSLAENREKAIAAFRDLPKPVLLHCSAGEDRSAPVAAYIEARLMKTSGPH